MFNTIRIKYMCVYVCVCVCSLACPFDYAYSQLLFRARNENNKIKKYIRISTISVVHVSSSYLSSKRKLLLLFGNSHRFAFKWFSDLEKSYVTNNVKSNSDIMESLTKFVFFSFRLFRLSYFPL